MLWNSAIWNRDLDKQCFCILWHVQMMSSKSKQKVKIFDTSKMNKLKHVIESENQHYAQDFKQQFHHSYHPYLEHFSQRSSCSVLIRSTDNDSWGNKTLQVASIWHQWPLRTFWKYSKPFCCLTNQMKICENRCLYRVIIEASSSVL